MRGPSGGEREILALVREQSDVLTRLEEITGAEERALPLGGDAHQDPAAPPAGEVAPGESVERAGLLARLQEIARRLGTLGRMSPEAAEAWSENRRRAQDLFRRTSDLLAVWRTRREDLVSSLERIRGGRQAVDAYRPDGREAVSVNLRR